MYPNEAETKSTSIFINKLWKMVNDPSTNHLIHWDPAGTSFVIPNPAQFWYELLPRYYKHNNLSSFVRQLNMYGFHKVLTLENANTQHSEKDKIQFSHPCFVRDQPERVKEIKRNGGKSKASEKTMESTMVELLTELKQLTEHQVSVNNQLEALKKENVLLWRELNNLREQNLKQEQIVRQLMEFLATVVRSRLRFGVKRENRLRTLRENLKKIQKDQRVNLMKDDFLNLDFTNDERNLVDAIDSALCPEIDSNTRLQHLLNNNKDESFFDSEIGNQSTAVGSTNSELGEFNYLLNEADLVAQKYDSNTLEFFDDEKIFQ